ncbi:MAG: tRNA (adenosine(37)-N6)-threonylcarbamoyltransferase complex ATPase subunit type 1 TsaE [Candidatus Liberibacter ctenarytainae]|uniref:tRNA threonylcarbamoyladenosine biosynthesis protein TsaE n=1 Tax=Candidatus Liberibacter ctenarytainae TaxID=2020335 RepID=A0A937DLT1_9HYPH|nr:tRNA (adenosine(37)-N6)-threonylcarbamoyltransferase complex ATPase subunit type 1 TsaE [Candidatus Liberibacter ctenarytainae]
MFPNTFDSIIMPLPHETDTICLGKNLACILKRGDCLALSGDLGSGKSFLARAIIRYLKQNEALEVLSPTFTLVQIYESKIPIAHFDFYRLSNPKDFFELGFDDLLNEGICIVEWPDLGKQFLPRNRIRIQLDYEKTGRKATVLAEKEIINHLYSISSLNRK